MIESSIFSIQIQQPTVDTLVASSSTNQPTMKPIHALVLLFSFSCLFAEADIPFNESKPKADHLKEVNKFWEGKPASQEQIAFASEADRIQAHLFGVYNYLKSNTPEGLSNDQLEKRSKLLIELKLYAKARTFPRNTGHAERTPYFIDQFNTACAVGNLMLKAGPEDLALFLKEQFNFNYIAEMPQKEVALWARNHGFEVWELEWIQPTYPLYPTTRFEQKNNQLMSPVNKVHYIAELEMTCYATSGENIYASPFNCVKDDGTFMDYGYHLNGKPMDFEYGFDDKMVVGGEFVYGDSTYGLAILEDPDTRTFWKMPNQEKYITRAVSIDGDILYFSAEISDSNTLIYKWEVGQAAPTEVASVNGRVNALENRVSQLFIAGKFSSATNGNGTISNCNNIVWLQSNILNPMAEGFDGYVNQLRVIDWEVYAVGACPNATSFISGSCAKKWTIAQWESLLSDSSVYFQASSDSAQIFDIVKYGDTLVFGSNFRIDDGGMMYTNVGNSLGTINENLVFEPKSYINGSVKSMTINGNGKLEIGGDFSSYTYHMPGSSSWIEYAEEGLMYSGQIAYGLVGQEEIETPEISFFPNPTSNFINITSLGLISDVKIYDLAGKLIMQSNNSPSAQARLDVSNLAPSNYILEVKAEGSLWRRQFTVN